MHKTSKDYIKNYQDSKIAKGETNDCVVRALASTFDMTYDEAHSIAKEKFGRKDRDGTSGTIITFQKLSSAKINNKNFSIISDSKLKYPGSPRYIKEKNPHKLNTQPIVVRQLLEMYPKGKYFVLISRHAFSLIDGVIIGNPNDGVRMNAKVLNLIKVEE
jgi:hypothetical protein